MFQGRPLFISECDPDKKQKGHQFRYGTGKTFSVIGSWSQWLESGFISTALNNFLPCYKMIGGLYVGLTVTIAFTVMHLDLYREHLRGKYHCTVDLLFDRFRNVPLCCVH